VVVGWGGGLKGTDWGAIEQSIDQRIDKPIDQPNERSIKND
jgi:uncharacterized protein YheU (UPF0270 family)